ncbi:sigma-70 family RNA polymerase sigma factor [Micromonospora sp. NPDC047812]|uniref:sigma-70 family RNA polymerase sigma factor n=1 Tax=Micromonospora sp. NPDC047812 TaxID=3155742 RepID=UPI0034544DB0
MTGSDADAPAREAELPAEALDPPHPDVAALVTAARAGDAAALAELLAAHLPLVQGITGRALDGHADADDLVQETMVRAIRGLPELREPDRFRSWLVSIAYRQVQLHLRGQARARSREQDTDVDLPDRGGDLAERTVAELILSDQRRELAEATDWLDDDDRRLLRWWWREAIGELTRAELAEALSVSPKHASVRLGRMRTRLDESRLIVRALRASPRCPDLAALLRGWDGSAGPLWRKRLSRHGRGCPRCGSHRHVLLAPERLLPGMTTFPVAAGLVAGVPGTPASFWAVVQGLFAHKVVAGTAVVTVAAGGLGYAVLQAPEPGLPAQAGPTMAAQPSPPTTVPTATAPIRPADPVTGAEIHVAPDGSDAGTGSAGRPYATLGRAVAVVRPGQTIVLRGGVHQLTEPVVMTTSGTARARITLRNHRDERAVVDASRVPAGEWAITQRASYWTVRGLEIRNAPGHGYVCVSCRHTVFSRLSVHDNGGIGLLLRDPGTVGNQVLDSDFHANHDTSDAGGTADGLAFKYGSGTGNLIRGCRMYHNSADGLDLSEFTDPVTVERSWAYGNGVDRWGIPDFTEGGGNGFKLGGGEPAPEVRHRVARSAAWDNAGYGFTEAGNHGELRIANNTAYRNGKAGFAFVDSVSVLRRNLALANRGTDSWLGAAVDDEDNSWNQRDWATTTLRSGDPSSAQGPRRADGALPVTTFLLNRRDPVMGADMR